MSDLSARQRRKLRQEEKERALDRFERGRRRNVLATPGPHPFVIILDHLKPDFNVGKIFRAADAFGAYEIHLVGVEWFDPASSMGSFRWVPAHFYQDFKSCYRQLAERGYTFFTLEPMSGASLPATNLPEKSAFIFGNEELGIRFDKADYPDMLSLSIPQFGRVQSLNVSVAASIVMYEYARQHSRSGLQSHSESAQDERGVTFIV